MKKEYMKFDSRSKEAFNTAQLAAVLARGQEYLLPLRFDSNGADVLAYNPATNVSRPIQIKARATVDSRYRGKNLWIAFPHWVTEGKQDWYLILHDDLLELWGQEKLQGRSIYSVNSPSRELLSALTPYSIGSVALS